MFLDRQNNNQTKPTRSDNGRSMVEIIAVLALIGVLSVGGIWGYTATVQSYQVGETVNEISLGVQGAKGLQVIDKYGSQAVREQKAYVVPVKELVSGVDYVAAENSQSNSADAVQNAFLTRTQTPVWVRVEDDNGFTINVSGLSQNMCQKLLSSDIGFFAAFKGSPNLDVAQATLPTILDKTYQPGRETVIYSAEDLVKSDKSEEKKEQLCAAIDPNNYPKSQAALYREYLANTSNKKSHEWTVNDWLSASVAQEAKVDMSPLVLYFKSASQTKERPSDPSFSCHKGTPYDEYSYSNGFYQVSPVCCSDIGGRTIGNVCCAVGENGKMTGKDWNGSSHLACSSGLPLEPNQLCQSGTSISSESGASDAWCCASDPDGAHGVWVPLAGMEILDNSNGTCCRNGGVITSKSDKGGVPVASCCQMQKRRGRFVPTPFVAGTNKITKTCCEAAGYLWADLGAGKGVCCDGKYPVNETGVSVKNDENDMMDACCFVYGKSLGKQDCHLGPQAGSCCCKIDRVYHPNKVQNGICAK